ncbi:MAG TPA: lipid-binding SYLF domain-containing protein [Vicinamibacterales bacterium]|jgi:lipid-binding SYLF domain-containing protein|nr:lipid-binding SYLF domain-containing protein [Vicinamibacterales bacterium]
MRRILWGTLIWLIGIGAAAAAIPSSDAKRLNEAAQVVTELRATPEKGIPGDLWDKAACVVVIPGMKKAAFVFGGEYGKGVMSCRTGNAWSAPVFMQLAKGSWGLQIGAQAIDLVLLVMNREGADKLLGDKVTLGADAAIAAGPVGRSGTAATDARLSAEILSYSRTKGIFAGIDLSGGVLRPDKDVNEKVYGAKAATEIIASTASTPAEARAFVNTLGREARATTGQR